MQLKIIILQSDRPIYVSVLGLQLEITNMEYERELTIYEDSVGNLTVELQEPAFPEEEQPQFVEPVYVSDIPPSIPVYSHESVTPQEQNDGLFKELVTLRKKLSVENNVPPYVIFHDKSLRDMCRVLPGDLKEFSCIEGVGKAKLEKYGLTFLDAIHKYQKGLTG